ncbi:MAG: hypothetical protein IJ122_04985 [Methanobrevibacter sp.]|nr:hypothetical protein [Methanobrevibacter sp.]
MKNIFKILIGVSILLLMLGSVYAADLSDVQLPADFKSKSDVYAENGDFVLTSMEYDKYRDHDSLFAPTQDYQIKSENNIHNFTDGEWDSVGVFEIVEIDGKPVVIDIYYAKNDDAKIKECYDYILEFNKLNNVEPIQVD